MLDTCGALVYLASIELAWNWNGLKLKLFTWMAYNSFHEVSKWRLFRSKMIPMWFILKRPPRLQKIRLRLVGHRGSKLRNKNSDIGLE